MRTPQEVAKRALSLGLISLRAQAENGILGGQEAYREFGSGLLQWAGEQKLDTFLAPKEAALHRKRLGSWLPEEISNGFWRLESAKAQLWALRCYDAMPSYVEGEVNSAYERLPLQKDIGPFLQGAQLRLIEELENERTLAEFYHWRATTEILRLRGMQPPPGDSYQAVVARALEGVTRDGMPVEHDGTDILVRGTRFIDLDPESKQDVISISYERHLGLCWLCGEDPWEETSADT